MLQQRAKQLLSVESERG